MKKLLAILLPLGIAAATVPQTVSAQQTDGLTPYGQIRIWTGYVKQSKEVTGSKAETDFALKNTSTRFGVKGKSGDIDAVIELGVNGASDDSAANIKVTTRHAYAKWNYSKDINFLLGQTDAPFTTYGNSTVDDSSLLGFGSTSQPRDLQIKATLFGFYVDFLNPNTKLTFTAADGTKTTTSTNTDILYPKTAIGYDLNITSESLSLLVSPGAAFQSIKVDKEGNAVDGKKINSFLAYAHALLKTGGFSVLANAGYGVNTGNLGLTYSGAFTTAPSSIGTASKSISTNAVFVGDKIKNTTSIEGFIDAGYDFGAAEVRGGIGYAQAKNDAWDKTDQQIVYYGQLSIPLVPGKLFLKPGVEYRDFKKDNAGNKQGNEIVAGSFIQAIF
ncbi:MAG TPA: hypothetical protein PKK43_11465 [Spirochaetota bacterium]|nr:hypothetical protein [Spirochaetota bacterium]